jgi:competence protein ComEA
VVPAPSDEVEDRPRRRPAIPSVLTETVLPWLRFVGPAKLLGGLGVGLVLAGVAWWMLRSPGAPTEARLPVVARAAAADGVVSTTFRDAPTATPTAPTTSVVLVHVTGAVRTPGVYELQPGQRVADAIDAAGGALANADPNALNLAAPLTDGDRIAVPAAGAASAPAGHSHAPSAAGDVGVAGPVDVNAATAAELDTLPGIGPATAAAIVEHREDNGPFLTVDDLDGVPGIGTAKLEAIRDLVTV